MHYYQFNIGDYTSHTKHLSLVEDAIYRRLLDLYYLHERPLDDCLTTVARLINARGHEKKVAAILKEFFSPTEGGGWVSERAKQEIERYHHKIEAASRAGKVSAQRRLNDRSTDVQLTNNHKPITKKQEKENTKEKIVAPEGVSESTWKSFLEQRKKARAVVTDTVLQSIAKESKKAGWTVEQAMTEMVVRGWRGFKADWVAGAGVVEKPVRWNSSVQGIMEKGKEFGIEYRQGMTIGQYEDRIKEAMALK